MDSWFLLLPTLLLFFVVTAYISKAMAASRTLMVNFSDDTNTEKIRVDPAVVVSSGVDLYSLFNVSASGYLGAMLEIMDRTSGKYKPLQLADPLNWTNGMLIVLCLVPTKQDAVLAIKGRAFDLPEITIGGKLLQVKEHSQADLGTGLNTWDGAIVLAKYLEKHRHIVSSASVLELGAGTGVAGIAAALLGADTVTLSDLPYVIDNLKENVKLNTEDRQDDQGTNVCTNSRIDVQVVDWFDRATYPVETAWDYIIGADVVWLEHLVPGLIDTLVACARPNTQILLSHQVCAKSIIMYETIDMCMLKTDSQYWN